MKRFAMLSLCALMLWLASAVTEAKSVSGRLFTGETMSSSNVMSLCQDQYGFIWVGTEYGLNRFDGYHFRVYQYDSNDSTSLPHNEVCRLLSDSQGRLWVGTATDLALYDFEHNHFVRMAFPEDAHPRINSLIETHDGDIYVGTDGRGVFVLRKNSEKLERDEAFMALTHDNFVSRLCEDADGNIWVTARDGTFYCVQRKGGVTQGARSYKLDEGLVQQFYVDREGRLYGVFSKALMIYNKGIDTWQSAGYELEGVVASASLSSVVKTLSGNLYLGTTAYGVLTFRNGKKTPEEVTFNNLMFRIDKTSITNMMEDRDGNLWVGCFRKGLALLNKQNAVFRSWTFSSLSEQYSDAQVSSLTPDEAGGVWGTAWNVGVFHFDAHGKATTNLKVPNGTALIYRDADGAFWLGAGGGLYQYNPTTGDSKLVEPMSGWINTICDDRAGHLFVSEFGRGIVRYDKKTGETHRYSASDKGDKGHLCNNWVGYMFVDSKKRLWLSTAKGVSCLDLRDDNFLSMGWQSLLDNGGIGPVCEDTQGNIVIGTFSGLYIYNQKQKKVELFPHSEALHDKTICGLACDDQGDLWISTPMGIWQYASTYKQFIHYHRGGQVSREYVRTMFLQGSDAMIGFGINDGVTTFYPQEVRGGSYEIGKVYLSEISVNGQWFSPLQEKIEIPYDENSFSISYSMLKYENVEAYSYEYRLNGGEWQSNFAGGGNVLSFNRMQPGTYQLEVRAVYGDKYSSENKLLTVVVKAPWYDTKLAHIIYILGALAVLGLLLVYYTRKKRMQMDEEKMRFLMNATHDIRTPLTLIVGPLNKLKSHVSDETGKAYLDTIDRNAKKLMMLVNQILDERKLDKGQMQIHCQETNIVDLISGVCKLYQYEAQQRNISFTFEHELNNVPLWVDRMNFDKVISNLLSNAFKYTLDSGEIKVLLTSQEREVSIQVIDSGIGFKKGESTKHLFERFHQGPNTVNLTTQGTGIGLNLCRSFVELHGGQIKADNRSDGQRGACFTVSMPTGNKHLKPEQIVVNENRSEVLSTSSSNNAHKNIRVMLVDDDSEIPDYIRFELGNFYKFTVCSNGKEALKALLTEGRHYDIVVSDVMMPEMDGVTLLKRIKENPHTSELPVILLTSQTEVEYRLEGLRKGADAYLAKPFDMEELHVQIDRLVGNVRRLRGVFTGASSQKDKVEDVEVKGNNDALMERVMKSINANLSDPDYNVEHLAKDVGLSRAQLHRKMKEMTGLATGKFVRDIRMQQAGRLIREGRVNVSQVAFSVGFNDQAHFSTVFKNYYGMSPSEYASQNTE